MRSFIVLISVSGILTSVAIALNYFHQSTTLVETDYCSETYANNMVIVRFVTASAIPKSMLCTRG